MSATMMCNMRAVAVAPSTSTRSQRAVAPVAPVARAVLPARVAMGSTRGLRASVRMAASSRRVVSVTAGEASAVNDSNFEETVLKSDIPVLVDFWAPWCGPCRMIAPLIDELAEEYSGKIKAVKLNTDESPGVATEYGIRSIPTCMIFKGGEKVDTIIGAVPKSTFVGTIEKFLD